MIRQTTLLFASAVLLLTSSFSMAEGPNVAGNLNGVELCIQEICGHAVFIGTYRGTVNGRFAFGYWWTVANHGDNPPTEIGPLPTEKDKTTNLAGEWGLEVYVLRGFSFRREVFGGVVAGTLTNRGDNNRPVDNFDVEATLLDGSTIFAVDGILRHDLFPPIINLTIGPVI